MILNHLAILWSRSRNLGLSLLRLDLLISPVLLTYPDAKLQSFFTSRLWSAQELTCDRIIELVSESAFNDSDEDSLSIGLVDSLSVGQAASITGLTATATPLENLFKIAFLHASPWPSVFKSSKELSSTMTLDGDQS
ncbi:hypothetical protein Hanom_Chr14g01307461 [Helianthus anomalus]